MQIRLACAKCDQSFVFDTETYRTLRLHYIPRQCPSCADRTQGRPETARVLARTVLAEFGACHNRLPPAWFQPYQAAGRDRPILRATLKGCPGGHGVSWSGRLDIFVLAQTLPQVVRVRVMEVTHAAGHTRDERPGEVTYPPSYQYISLEPEAVDVEPITELIYASVGYKTTLKGFGVQYYADLITKQALFAHRLESSARSGRFGTYGAVAVVDENHPVITRQWGDVSATRYYPPDGEAVIVAELISPDGRHAGQYDLCDER